MQWKSRDGPITRSPGGIDCSLVPHVSIHYIAYNKKHLKNVGPIRHCEPLHALILHCHSPGVATVERRLRIDVHDNDNDDDNNDNDNA